MNRRQLFLSTMAALAGTAALSLSAGFSTAQAQEIRVLNWNGYGTDEKFAVAKFKEVTGVTVVHDYYTSEQEMLTKMRTSPGAYDVVMVPVPFVPAARDEGLIEAIDTAKISNFANIAAQFAENEIIRTEGQVWGVPWVWGVSSFAYNTETITDNLTSLNALWDPKFAGRVALRDDGILNVQIAALALGQDMNNPSDDAAIKAKLIELKPQIRSFWASEDEWLKGMAAKNFDIAQSWSGAAARAATRHKLPVKLVIPDEGATAWLDTLAISSTAPNKEAAEKFIDYMISPDFYVTWDTEAGAPVSANSNAVAALPDTAFNKTVLGSQDVLAKLRFSTPLTDERQQEISDMWAEVKTEFAQ